MGMGQGALPRRGMAYGHGAGGAQVEEHLDRAVIGIEVRILDGTHHARRLREGAVGEVEVLRCRCHVQVHRQVRRAQPPPHAG